MKLYENGIYLVNGTEIIEDNGDAAAKLAQKGITADKAEAAKGTMAYNILKAHNIDPKKPGMVLASRC